jgi:predicted dehydrogenase
MDNLDRFFLDGTAGYAELLPATGYGPTKGRTNKGELTQPDTVHQTVQMDEMSGILLQGHKPVVPVDGEEALRDAIIIDAIYEAARTGQKVMMKA